MLAIILCGGSGTRLWPVSREAMPKPFMRIGGGPSLLQRTALRSKRLGANSCLVVTNGEYTFKVTATRGTEKLGIAEYDADRMPPLFGKVGADYRLTGVWTVSAYSFFAARQDRLSPRDVTDPRINPAGTAGYVTTNMAATWNVREALDLRLSAENLADRKYREHGTGLDEAGRSFGVGLDWRF